jgi:hypothetical protein
MVTSDDKRERYICRTAAFNGSILTYLSWYVKIGPFGKMITVRKEIKILEHNRH